MADVIKILAPQVALTATGNTVAAASVVRVSLISSGNALISRQYSNGTTIATTFLGTSDPTICLTKQPDELIAANASNLAVGTSIAYM